MAASNEWMTEEPVGGWIFELAGPVIFVGMLGYVVADTVRHRRLSLFSLGFIGGLSMWWLEWYGDWASYLLYNPNFELMGWDSTQWTSPNKPWAVIPAYGWWYAIVFAAMLGLIGLARKLLPGRNRWVVLLGVTIPVFYAWDLFVEGFAAYLGWWSYTDGWGPELATDRGSFPLLYPILPFVAFGVIATIVMDLYDDRGRLKFEVAAGAHRLREGWQRETGRAAAWIVTMNVLYIVILIGPIIAVREAWGPESTLVP